MTQALAGKRTLAGALILAACGWLVLHRAADAAWAVQAPERAAAFPPASGTALGSMVLHRVVAAGGVVDAGARAMNAEALRRAPLSSLPPTIAGFDAAARGDLPQAVRLMEAARARDPRAALARTWLLNEYARTGRYGLTLAEAGPVMRFDAGTRPQIYALIMQILGLPGGGAAVRAALAREPDWRGPFVQALPGLRPSPAALAALTQGLSPPRDPAAAQAEARALQAAVVAQ
ncbi:MAG: hypothetical protein KGL44_02425 [Sphingomonadales bacterium]|nr:hypothetical protein [Sphingomonadales bacterium]